MTDRREVQSNRTAPEVLCFNNRFRKASQVMAFFVSALGLLVFCGWAFKVPALTFIRPGLQSMKVNTALSFLCLGAGLWLAHDDKRQRSRRILGLLVVIIAGLTLAEYAFHINLGIDQLLFRDTRTPSLSAYPGRMAIATAICFLSLGSAVAFLGLKNTLTLQRTLVGACFTFSLVALCGYLYGVKPFYSITSYSTTGLHTVAGLFAACIAYFLARPDQGIVSIAARESSSGYLVRRLVPAIVIVPILLGWLGLVGQRANLYDVPFGTALFALASIGCLTLLTILIGRSANSLESERFHAERTMRESEQRFRLVADTAPVLIWMSGTDKLCTYFNKRWLDFTGRSMEQELGNGWAEGVHPDDLQRCLDIYTLSFDRLDGFKREYRLRHHDGEYRWILDIGVPRLNQDGSFAGYIGIGVDVTDRKHAEHALAESEERLRLAQSAARIGTFEWNIRTGVNTWTPELEAMYGLPPGGFGGTQTAFENLVHPDDRAGVIELVGDAMKTGQPTKGEWRVVLGDGSVHWIAGRWQVFMNESGEPSRMLGVNVDVTEHKLAEQELA